MNSEEDWEEDKEKGQERQDEDRGKHMGEDVRREVWKLYPRTLQPRLQLLLSALAPSVLTVAEALEVAVELLAVEMGAQRSVRPTTLLLNR